VSRSGGIVYHLRAYRFQNRLWHTHQQKVGEFLELWNPNAEELLLFGPSAGYSLSQDFLKKFRVITAVEPDPLARILFEKRFQIKPNWIKHKIRFDDKKDLLQFQEFKGAILFCNLLGQIPMKTSKKVKKVLNEFLENRNWASFHDAMSGNKIEFDCEDAPKRKATLAEMRSWIYIKNPKLKEVQVNAHLAPELFDESQKLSFQYWLWTISDQQSQLIEGVYCKP
jgi:hypothetical protein